MCPCNSAIKGPFCGVGDCVPPRSGLEATEAECAANATAPRVTLAKMEAQIAERYDFTAGELIAPHMEVHPSLHLLSMCILVMANGFSIIGKSAPASPANFNADLGRKLAYEDAIRQLWPLEGYALRDRLLDGQRA